MRSIISAFMISGLAISLAACMGPINKNVAIGDQAFVAKNYSKAFAYYRSAASYGNLPAEYALGYLYYYGLGVQRSEQKAINWWSKAASWNYPPARNVMTQLNRDMPVFQD